MHITLKINHINLLSTKQSFDVPILISNTWELLTYDGAFGTRSSQMKKDMDLMKGKVDQILKIVIAIAREERLQQDDAVWKLFMSFLPPRGLH